MTELEEPPSLEFFVPGEPTPKGRPRTFFDKKMGRVFTITPDRTKRYEGVVQTFALQAMGLRPEWKRPTADDRFFIELDLRFTGEASCDADNVLKAIADGLQPLPIPDDKQILGFHVSRSTWELEPGVMVRVTRRKECVGKRQRPEPKRKR